MNNLLERIKIFLSIDWKQVEQSLTEIDEGVLELENIAEKIDENSKEINALSEVLGLFYEEKYGKLKWKHPNLFDLEE